MSNRIVYHVVHSNADGRWHLREGDRMLADFDTKDDAVGAGKVRGLSDYERGRLAQLMVHRQDGSFEIEYTYGEDPRAHVG